jgi:eukaryotic-like serine/threonine-protein kinase
MDLRTGENTSFEKYQFGSFEVQVRSGTLLCEGRRTKIQDLPFRMLLVLLENAGEIVSRAELRNRLWNEETFGDFDNSLRVAAAKLRAVLGDSVTEPRYIRTVSGRGYQFIGAVVPVPETTSSGISILEHSTGAGLEREPAFLDGMMKELPLLVTAPPVHETAASAAKQRRLFPVFAISFAAAALVAGTGVFLFWYQNRPLANDQDMIAVGGVVNHSGDHAFDDTLSEAFRIKIDESPYLNLIPDGQFRRSLKTRQAAPSLEEELQGCRNVGAKILLRGEILPHAPGYLVRLGAWRCNNGHLLTAQQATAESSGDILQVLNEVSKQMRRRLGEPDISLQRFDVPLPQATTASLAALKAFTQGEQKHFLGQEAESIPDYKIAVDLDPQFALAYARLGTLYSNIGQRSLARQYYQKAFDLRSRTTDHERLYIAAHYYDWATGEIPRAIETYRLWSTLYPHDWIWSNNLANIYLATGEPEKAIDLIWTAIHSSHSSPSMLYSNLALAYLRSGDYTKLASLCADPSASGAHVMLFHDACYLLAYTRGDHAGEQRELDLALKHPGENAELIDDAANVALYRGQPSEWRRLFQIAAEGAQNINAKELASLVYLDQADQEAELGFANIAKEKAEQGLALDPASPDVRAYTALAFARSGGLERAEAEAAKAAAESPQDTILNSVELASVRAVIDTARNNPQAAIQSLEASRPYDFCIAMRLSPAYYRGLAYMQNHQPDLAAREFQHVLDHRSVIPNSLYLVLAQHELEHMRQAKQEHSIERSHRS